MNHQVRAGTGRCVGTDTAAWFSVDPADVAWCQEVCGGCPLRAGCLAGARLRDEQWGIWGGVQFSPRVASCWAAQCQGRWQVCGFDVFGVRTYHGSYPTRDLAQQRAVEVLAESHQRWAVGEQLRASTNPRLIPRIEKAPRRSAA